MSFSELDALSYQPTYMEFMLLAKAAGKEYIARYGISPEQKEEELSKGDALETLEEYFEVVFTDKK